MCMRYFDIISCNFQLTFFSILEIDSQPGTKLNHRQMFFFFSCSNDDMEEGDPGSDSDFEIDAKKEVSSMKPDSGY